MITDICLILAVAFLAFIVVKLGNACAELAKEVVALREVVAEIVGGVDPDGGVPADGGKVVRLDSRRRA